MVRLRRSSVSRIETDSVVDGVTVLVEPGSRLTERDLLGLDDLPLARWADIEEVVASRGCDV